MTTVFDWSGLPGSVIRDLAAALGIPRRGAVERLAGAYPEGPTADLVGRAWPAIRDGWVARDPDLRSRVVVRLRSRGLGNTRLDIRTAAEQKAYLRTCRNASGLRESVAQELRAAPTGSSPAPGGDGAPSIDAKVTAAWAAFERRLTRVLEGGAADDHVVVELPTTADGSDETGGYYVQWAVDGDDAAFEVEAVSNHYLPSGHRLTGTALGRMAALGWQPPEAEGEQHNFHLTVPRDQAADLAHRLVRTLRDVYAAPHPVFLTARGLNGEDTVDVSGLRLAAPSDTADDVLMRAVTAAIAENLHRDPGDLVVDEDGDIPIRSGSAMIFVRVQPQWQRVDLFSPVLLDVTDSPELRARLIGLQTEVPYLRFGVQDDVVTAGFQVMANPFEKTHLCRALDLMAAACDDVDDVLQSEFGGRTFFGQVTRTGNGTPSRLPSTSPPEVGGYL
ncbi:MAG: hypothetical protein R2737_00360 [Candidatus Nanopelagicales bacterium]